MRYQLADYPQRAKALISTHNLQKYIDVLLDYWEVNPTTLGHGFEHVLKAAVECYELADDNGYDHPEELFVAGIFHDVYRPAEGKDAKEDHHEQTGKILKLLFEDNDLDKAILAKLLKNSEEQDKWRYGDEEPDLFDLYLFIGERAAHIPLMADAYAWASNKFCRENNLPLAYEDHLDSLNSLVQYQPAVWKLFKKYKHLIGIQHSIEGYVEMYKNAAGLYSKDPKGIGYIKYLNSQAEKCRKLEENYLQAFGCSAKKISSLMNDMY